jgi:hypothetical protein
LIDSMTPVTTTLAIVIAGNNTTGDNLSPLTKTPAIIYRR